MTRVLIVESNPAGTPVAAPYFSEALAAIDPRIETRVVAPYDAPVTAGVLHGIDGVIFTGSAVRWGVDAPEAAPLRAVMEQVFHAGAPTYGACNGMQMAAVVLGGTSTASPNGNERGVAVDIKLTGAGRTHPFLAGRNTTYSAICIHRDEVTALPKGAVLLSGNAHSPVQGFVYEQSGVSFWGVQYHPEISPSGVAEILHQNGYATPDVIADLRAAETDTGAAARLGAAPGDLTMHTRLTEMRNWVAHITP